jgi:serine-type D-Ala-D-Ala carboxypeptidase/endopeptidase (penicillin-binding protein 4)
VRALAATLAATAGLLGTAPAGAWARPLARAALALSSSLSQTLGSAGGSSGAYVLDLTTGQPLFSAAAGVGRLPASVEKLYTTSTALLRFGPSATLATSVLGSGTLDGQGGWHGALYLRGGGDPTFGSLGFDRSSYGTGATIGRLVGNLVRTTGIASLQGRIVGDESYFDSLRGTPATGFRFSPYVEGSLSAVSFNRGLTAQGSGYVVHPAVFAAGQLASALRSAHVRLAPRTQIRAGATPPSARLLATVSSPRMAKLVQLTNTPSDNYFAETLLKGLGARFGAGGSTAAGAAVVRAELASRFGIHPRIDDGSGLSRADSTSPRQVVTLLSGMAGNPAFVGSLAVAGETGTLQTEMQGTIAQGRCRGKTGTLHDVASLVGYCQARDGHTIAFAFLMNSLSDSSVGHAIEADMAVTVAGYDG